MKLLNRLLFGMSPSALTALEKKERVKKAVVIALALVTCLMAYFRFGYEGGSTAPTSDSHAKNQTPFEARTKQISAIDKTVPKFQIPLVYDTVGMRDIFRPAEPPRHPDPSHHASGTMPPLKLIGIVSAGANPVAIINNQLMRIGEQLNGYRLVKITNNSAFLSSPGHQTELKVLNLSADP